MEPDTRETEAARLRDMAAGHAMMLEVCLAMADLVLSGKVAAVGERGGEPLYALSGGTGEEMSG